MSECFFPRDFSRKRVGFFFSLEIPVVTGPAFISEGGSGLAVLVVKGMGWAGDTFVCDYKHQFASKFAENNGLFCLLRAN